MPVSVTFEFTGDLRPAAFAEFAAHRAARLSVGHAVVALDRARAVVCVTGPEVLVEAFEMALSLGPESCVIHDVRRIETRTDLME